MRAPLQFDVSSALLLSVEITCNLKKKISSCSRLLLFVLLEALLT